MILWSLRCQDTSATRASTPLGVFAQNRSSSSHFSPSAKRPALGKRSSILSTSCRSASAPGAINILSYLPKSASSIGAEEVQCRYDFFRCGSL